MRIPNIHGYVFYSPLLIFPVVLSLLRFKNLKDAQIVMGTMLIIWLALFWFGKGVFYHVINLSTNLNKPYFEYPHKYDLGLPGIRVIELLPQLEINLDRYTPLVILALLIIGRYIYGIIFYN